MKKKIIFVCHGSICRSPAAAAICLSLTDRFDVVARALSYEEIGNSYYPPMKAELLSRGIHLPPHRSAFLSKAEFKEADFVFYMDESNRRLLVRYDMFDPKKSKPVFAFCPDITEIEDPWYTGRYDVVVDELTRCIKAIIENLD